MENEKRVIIGRPINGLSINGLEFTKVYKGNYDLLCDAWSSYLFQYFYD
jgi:hypothetical protein